MARTLIVGDVHGCADELDRLLRKARPDRVILVGDLFTRGPDPGGVWDLIEHWRAEAVLGNHDETVLRTWRKGKDLPRRAFEWLAGRPLILESQGCVVVHAGLHPRAPERTRPRQALTLRDWKGKPWWQRYRGERLVVHGHDARHGLVDRRPYTLCLDTACVRGGRLSGYLLEKDRVLSVKARRRYA